MSQQTIYSIMDEALLILNQVINLNVQLQDIIVNLRKNKPRAAAIFRKIKPLWVFQKEVQILFWHRYPVFNALTTQDIHVYSKTRDFLRFYSKVLKSVLYKLAFHSVNSNQLVFATPNLRRLIILANVKSNTPSVDSFLIYIDINISFQKIITQTLLEANYLTQIEKTGYQRFTDSENQEFIKIIFPQIQRYCSLYKQKIVQSLPQHKCLVPNEYRAMVKGASQEFFLKYLEESLKEQIQDAGGNDQFLSDRFAEYQQNAIQQLLTRAEVNPQSQSALELDLCNQRHVASKQLLISDGLKDSEFSAEDLAPYEPLLDNAKILFQEPAGQQKNCLSAAPPEQQTTQSDQLFQKPLIDQHQASQKVIRGKSKSTQPQIRTSVKTQTHVGRGSTRVPVRPIKKASSKIVMAGNYKDLTKTRSSTYAQTQNKECYFLSKEVHNVNQPPILLMNKPNFGFRVGQRNRMLIITSLKQQLSERCPRLLSLVDENKQRAGNEVKKRPRFQSLGKGGYEIYDTRVRRVIRVSTRGLENG